jgi:inorganic triphosphatase YgiF
MKTITLDELNELAALQTRVDRKYIVPRGQVAVLLGAMDSHARVLEIDGVQSFGYESVYFDTPDLLSFYGAAHKRRRRFKVRTRTYTDSGDCYLEVKTEGARAATVKERLEHASSPDAIGPEGRAYARSVLEEAGIHADVSDLNPVLSTSYRRRTLYIPGSQSRATIDTDLAWQLHDGERIAMPDHAIVETKSGSTASSVDRLLWSAGHRPSSISKYATGMAALRPDLPSNKWAPILRHHFLAERAAS